MASKSTNNRDGLTRLENHIEATTLVISAGHGRLNDLYDLLARSRAITRELEERIAEDEGVPTAVLYQRRRRAMHVVA